MKKDYFKGWYFKCCSGGKTIAFIPAYHCSDHSRTASLQVIMDDRSACIPYEDLTEYRQKPLTVKLGDNIFSARGIRLDVKCPDLYIHGKLWFRQSMPLRYDIMGPFALLPSMQCRHSVYSMRHRIDGSIIIDGQRLDFQNGTGYLEGDSGTSFPRRYIWTQCCFKNGSLMLAVADVPLWGLHFTGIVGAVLLGAREYRIATYLGARLRHAGENTVVIEQGGYVLTAELLEENALPLNAPVQGQMSRTIHESASCKVHYRFAHRGRTLLDMVSARASAEFEYK